MIFVNFDLLFDYVRLL